MIYLDSAATTLQKPRNVLRAVQRAMTQMASPGRGGYAAARLAEETVFGCRELAARFFDTASAEEVVFTFNATHGLNIAIKSLVPCGGRALISSWEHNAVTRPLHAISARVRVARAPLFDEKQTLRAFAEEIKTRPDAVICTHVSNVFGFRLPIEEIAAECRRYDVPLIVDASQSAGILPLSMRKLGAAYIAMPGHKSLYGPQGSGILLCGREGKPLLEGGTGSRSLEQSMPDFLPDRLEAGTPNVAAIAGLCEGLRFVCQNREQIAAHEGRLLQSANRKLAKVPGVNVFSSPDQAGVMSFTVEGFSPEEVAQKMAEKGIAVRAGLHCAPLAHQSEGTLPMGTVRMSVSAFNSAEEIEKFADILRQTVQKRGR